MSLRKKITDRLDLLMRDRGGYSLPMNKESIERVVATITQALVEELPPEPVIIGIIRNPVDRNGVEVRVLENRPNPHNTCPKCVYVGSLSIVDYYVHDSYYLAQWMDDGEVIHHSIPEIERRMKHDEYQTTLLCVLDAHERNQKRAQHESKR